MNLNRILRDRRHAGWLKAARRGDGDAFQRLYGELFHPICRYLGSRLERPEDVEDLTSDVFRRFLEHLDRYDSGKGSVLAWLLTMAHHRLVDHYRALRPTTSIDDLAEVLAGAPSGPSERLVRDERLQLARRLISELPPETRRMFALRFEQDLRYRDIAACLGISEAAVKQRFSRALRDMRATLEDDARESGEVDYAI